MQFHQQSRQRWRPTQKSVNDHINMEVEGFPTEDQNWRYNCLNNIIFPFIKYNEDNIHLLEHEANSAHDHNFITKLSKLLWLLHAHLENIKLNKSCAHNLVGKISLICQIFWISQFSLRRKFNPAFNNINQSVFIVKCFVHIVSWTNIWFTFCHILDISTLSLYFIPLDLPFEK